MNQVELQGRILNLWKGRNVAIMTLFVESDGPTKEEKRVNFPRVLFNRAEWGALEEFKQNDFVHITGTIKVRAATERGTNRTIFSQYVRGLAISPVRSEMSEKFDIDGLGGRFDFINEVLIEGTITNINTRHGVINMLVNPNDEKFSVSITDFAPNKDAFMSRYIVGSNVCIKCEVQTTRKEYEDESVVFFENLVVSYIVKKRTPRPTPVMDDPTMDL